MGLDLAFGIDPWKVKRKKKIDTWFLAYDRLGLRQDYSLFAAIKEQCKPKPIPEDMGILWYENGGLKETTVDAYGKPLTYLTAGELGKVILPNTSDWNKAIFDFIKTLPPETMIILWWH